MRLPILSLVLLASVLSVGCTATVMQPTASRSAQSPGQPPQVTRPRGQKPLVITNDKGGNVLASIGRRNRLESSGRPVEIRGYCASACTLLTTLPNACLGPDAVIGFHAPRIPNTRIIPPIVDEMMGRYYRNGILARWNADWKHRLEITRISAREYVALDPQTRICGR